MIWGNHDITLKYPKKAARQLATYFDEITSGTKELLNDLIYNESIILDVEGYTKNILLIHEHQADL